LTPIPRAPKIVLAMKDTIRRILITLALLAAYRFGFTVPVPGLSVEFLTSQKDQGSLVGLLSVFSGGAIGQTTIVALGLLPYLASVLFFWLLIQLAPEFKQLLVTSPVARRGVDRWKRVAVVPIAIVQAMILYDVLFLGAPEMIEAPMRAHTLLLGSIVVLSFVAGALFVMWIAEMITRHGLGHGVLLIVTAGVLARIPHAMLQLPSEEFWQTMLSMVAIGIASSVLVAFIWRGFRPFSK
jgi:preprotein translocase subunit SecY